MQHLKDQMNTHGLFEAPRGGEIRSNCHHLSSTSHFADCINK